MSDNNDLIQADELEPINATPEEPLKANLSMGEAMQDNSGLTEADGSTDSPTGVDFDLPDLPDEEDIGDFEPPSPGEVARRIQHMTRMQVFDYVIRVGAIYFEDGHELISCPARSTDAVCALRPTEHEITGNTVMTCTGPTTAAKTKGWWSKKTVFEAGKVKSGCPHHPDKRRELPEGLKELYASPSSQQIDNRLKDEYSR